MLTPEERERILEEERVRLQFRDELEAQRSTAHHPASSTNANLERARLGIALAYIGVTLLIAGIGALWYFTFIFAVSVPVNIPSELRVFAPANLPNVNNVGLMSDRQKGVIFGSVLALLGAGLMIPGLVLSAGCRKRGYAAYSSFVAIIAVIILAIAGSGASKKDVSRTISRAVGSSAADDADAKERLKQVAIAVMMFSGDHGGKFPDMSSDSAARIAVTPYVRYSGLDVFQDPASGKPWTFNDALSGMEESQLKFAQCVILAYSPEPLPDGGCYCAFADGHFKKLTKEAWETAQQTTKIEVDREFGFPVGSTLVPQ